MKCLALVVTAMTFTALLSVTAAAQNDKPLGDYARSVRKQQPSQKAQDGKRFDNDNLPQDSKISVVGPGAAENKDAAAADSAKADGDGSSPEANDGAKKADAGTPAGNDSASKNAANDEWKKTISDQKDQINLLSRELDVLQREYRLRAAAMYADVGNRLRNSSEWDKEDADYKQKIADKQKSLDEAKQKLDDMQEQARKAGVPSSARE